MSDRAIFPNGSTAGPADEAERWARVHELNRILPWQRIERDRTVQRELTIIDELRAIAALHRAKGR